MNISILGCGWLGFPLASSLVNEGHTVKGSTTTEEKLEQLSDEGITPYLLSLDPQLEGNTSASRDFFDADLLVLNIPPGRRRPNVIDFHTSQIASVIEHLQDAPVQSVIFASSTSVYPKKGGVMEEGDATPGHATRDSGEALIQAEQMLMDQDHFDTTVVRFGGLYGYDRHPANYLAGKKDIPGGNAPVNLIHRDDCINILTAIIENDIRGEIFNAVSDGHPPKNQFYKIIAEQAGLEPPSFLPDSDKDYKVVSNRKLKKMLDYQFAYPNPLDVAPAFSG
ncbi:SDR family oxidoreductase [Halalkalibaculum sp. DA384]|uniref:SDR family oxidoreductase n=1 Tax=Halalkalibaculum sp. DA384 TaxID=3373606 RepID=UPI003754DADB